MMRHELDGPIGYPLRGPSLQQRGIPARSYDKSKGVAITIGVVAGVATAGVGFGMAAAAGWSGGAALAGGAMLAGGTMSAIGAATQNQKLSKIGGILSLAGGIGSLGVDVANSANLGTSLKTGADTFSASVSKAMGNVSNAFSGAEKTVTGMQGAQTGGTGATIGLGGGADTAGAAGLSSAGSAPTTNTIGLGSGVNGSVQTGGLANAGTSVGAVSPGASSGSANQGLLSKVWDVANTNIGAQMISSMGNYASGSEAADAQAAYVSSIAAKYANDQQMMQQQIKNMNSPGVVFYNPNDPNAENIKAAISASGAQAQALGINQNANIQSPAQAAFGNLPRQGVTA